MEPHKITKEEFNSLFSDDITVGSQKFILAKIDERITYILKKLSPKMKWWTFAGRREEEEGEFFKSVDSSHEYIRLIGEFSIPEAFDYSDEWFSAHWLWTDFEEEYNKIVSDFIIAKETKRLKNIEKRKRKAYNASVRATKEAEIWASISQKLTTEELSYICLR